MRALDWTRRLARMIPRTLRVGSGVIALALLLAVVVYSAVELARFERGEIRRSVFILAAGQTLAPGVHVRAVDLAGTLGRLGYIEVRTAPNGPGQFRRAAGAWDIARRDGGERIRLETSEERITRVLQNGRAVTAAGLEGEVLTGGGDQAGEDYRPIRIAEAPAVLIDAVLAAEDRRFFDHGALDVRGLARALWVNVKHGRLAQGGSTITQQLIKNRLLTPQRTFVRKLREAWLAVLVELRYSKSQILEAYLNEVYLGQRGALAIRGVGTAARVYFAREPHQLTAGEAAMLAGMIRAPNTYSPILDPARARVRRDAVLAQMRDAGRLDAAAYRVAVQERVRAAARPLPGQIAAYFTDEVRQELEERFAAAGTRVVTTLDLPLQRFAENAVARGLDRLETSLPRLRGADGRGRLQAALVALDPTTGEIRALVGGRDYPASQFDRAARARRQPGSAFKPFVWATALHPRDGGEPLFTAASMIDDAPITIQVDGKSWTPRNYADRYEGRVSARRAIEQSLNSAAVRVAQAVGIPAVAEMARALGLRADVPDLPAAALGSFEVTPIDLARAYLPFANGGIRPGAVRTVRAVYRADGTSLVAPEEEPDARVLSPAEAYLMTSLLAGVVRSGTGSGAAPIAPPGVIGGKTGTTNEGRDAWFVGYSPRLLAVVWVGFDDGHPHGLSGAQAAVPIWADFMGQALRAYPAPVFAVPAGVEFADIDATNGHRAGPSCPVVVREAFLAGTEPPPCVEHTGVVEQIRGWWQRLFQWLPR